MNEATSSKALDTEEQVRLVLNLLKEYSDKLSSLIVYLLDPMFHEHLGSARERAAWLLDQGEMLRKPLSQIISRGSAFLEHMNLDITTENELTLRMREIEIHLHHATRLTHELKQRIDKNKSLGSRQQLGAQIADLRVSAGLN
jgi:hypothetical protein